MQKLCKNYAKIMQKLCKLCKNYAKIMQIIFITYYTFIFFCIIFA